MQAPEGFVPRLEGFVPRLRTVNVHGFVYTSYPGIEVAVCAAAFRGSVAKRVDKPDEPGQPAWAAEYDVTVYANGGEHEFRVSKDELENLHLALVGATTWRTTKESDGT